MSALSVIIPTHEKPERLTLALHALLAQDLPRTAFEVIVVADGCSASTDTVLESLLPLGLPLRTRTTGRIGQAAARNAGAAIARGRHLLFVDDDVLLCPDYLSTAVACLAGDGDMVLRAPVFLLRNLAAFRDPERGTPYAGNPHLSPVARLMQERISRARILGDWPWIASRCRHLNRFERMVRDHLTAIPQRTPWLGYSGSGVAVSKARFEAAGGYDEGFGLGWGAEAIELGYRLWQRGARFRHTETIYSAHMDHPRGAALETFDTSFDRFFEKHRDPDIRTVQHLIGASAWSAGDGRPMADGPANATPLRTAERAVPAGWQKPRWIPASPRDPARMPSTQHLRSRPPLFYLQ